MYICFSIKKKNWKSWILGIFIVLLYILHVYFFLYFKKKKMNVLDSWHIYCFIVQVTFFFFFHFLFVEILSDDALTLELDMSTPTPIEVDGWRLLFALWSGGIDDDIGFC